MEKDSTKVECPHCFLPFADNYLKQHIQKHYEPTKFTFKCLNCELKFDKLNHLKVHELTHVPQQTNSQQTITTDEPLTKKRKYDDEPSSSKSSNIFSFKYDPSFSSQKSNLLENFETTFLEVGGQKLHSDLLKEYSLQELYELCGIEEPEDEDEDEHEDLSQETNPKKSTLFPSLEVFLIYLVYQQEGRNRSSIFFFFFLAQETNPKKSTLFPSLEVFLIYLVYQQEGRNRSSIFFFFFLAFFFFLFFSTSFLFLFLFLSFFFFSLFFSFFLFFLFFSFFFFVTDFFFFFFFFFFF